MKINIVHLFPTTIYSTEYQDSMEEEKKFINNLEYDQSGDGSGNKKSKDTYVLNKPELSRINAFIKGRLKDFLENGMKVKNELVITQSWVNQSEKGTKHTEHHHPNSMISGVFYFTKTEDTPIVFLKRDNWGIAFDFDTISKENARSAVFKATPGALIMFPSSLNHAVPMNMSDDIRISLSFNTFARNFLGDEKNLTYVQLNNSDA